MPLDFPEAEGLKRAPQAALRVPTHCPSLRVWVTHIVTHVRYQHRTLSMSAAAAPTRDTMYVHSKGHEVGTPYTSLGLAGVSGVLSKSPSSGTL